MAKIVREEELHLTAAEAVALVKNADGRVRFNMIVRGWAATTEDRGYEVSTGITVSRGDMLKAIPQMLSPVFEEKGAKLRVHTTPATYDGGLAFISVY